MKRISILGMRDPVFGDITRVNKNLEVLALGEHKDEQNRTNTSKFSPDLDTSPQLTDYRRQVALVHSRLRLQNRSEDQGSASPIGSSIRSSSPVSRHGRISPSRTTLPQVPFQQSPNVARDFKAITSTIGRNSQRSLSSHRTASTLPCSSSPSQSRCSPSPSELRCSPSPPLPVFSVSPPLLRPPKSQRLGHVIPAPPLGSFSSPPSISKQSATVAPLQQPEKTVKVATDSSGRGSNSDFAPPDGSFYFRKPNERPWTPTKELLMKDIALARRVQSLYQDDDLMTGSACDMESAVSSLLLSMYQVETV